MMPSTAQSLKYIPVSDLIAFDDFVAVHPVRVDLVYAQPHHVDNIFKAPIYRPEAKMWGHRDLVSLVLDAANICYKKSGWIFELKDCLRTVEAQALMQETDIVKANPHWLEEPNRLLSPPGKGGHPRGMAIDIILIDNNGTEIDMGTSFDHLTKDPHNNPAARHYTRFSEDETRNREIIANRKLLEESMMQAAANAGRALLPLPQEWWDFRFMPDYSASFEPIRDADLPPNMRMTAL